MDVNRHLKLLISPYAALSRPEKSSNFKNESFNLKIHLPSSTTFLLWCVQQKRWL